MMLFKKRLLILSLATLPFSVESQEIVDKATVRAVYDFSYKVSPEKEQRKQDLLYLDMGQRGSLFYSVYNAKRDSAKKSLLAQGHSPQEVIAQLRGYPKGKTTNPIIYKEFRSQQVVHAEKFMIKHCYYEEAIQMPKWQIGDQMHELLGYHCQEAKATFLGREWHVWFTQEIPLNDGPWKLWGLPGLILKAADSDHFFSFELKGFEQLNPSVPIVLPLSNDKENRYDKVTKKDFFKIEKALYENPIQFLEMEKGTKINVERADNRPLKVEYIPLER